MCNDERSYDDPLTIKGSQVFIDKIFDYMKSDVKKSMIAGLSATTWFNLMVQLIYVIDKKKESLKENLKRLRFNGMKHSRCWKCKVAMAKFPWRSQNVLVKQWLQL